MPRQCEAHRDHGRGLLFEGARVGHPSGEVDASCVDVGALAALGRHSGDDFAF